MKYQKIVEKWMMSSNETKLKTSMINSNWCGYNDA